MPGRAYTPGGVEPDIHEKLAAPAPEVMDAYRKASIAERSKESKPVYYKEAMEYRKRGEGHALGHYVYEMWYDIYAGIEEELLVDAIDSHMHIYPDYVPRATDIIQLAIDASKLKMKGVVCKDHFFTNVGQAWAAQRWVEEMVKRGELEQSCTVLGTHILAWSHHPDQINLIRKYPNLGGVFFSTMTSHGGCGPTLPILDSSGKLMSEVKECIAACAEYKICIMTGHREAAEQMAIVQYGHTVGARILVTHAGSGSLVRGNVNRAERIAQCREMGKLGAFLEVGGNKFVPNLLWPCVDPNAVINVIHEFGPQYIVANTDFGQVQCGPPLEEFKLFIRGMLHAGISKEDIKTMISTNPKKALFLDEK